MSEHTCLYCDTAMGRRNKKVCKEHFNHHRMVLHYKRNGRDINARHCADCGADIGGRAGNAKRCVECQRLEKNRDQRERKLRQTGPKSARPCRECGRQIGEDRRRDAKFCSRKCIDDYRTKNVDRTDYYRSTQPRRSEYSRQWCRDNPASTKVSRARRRVRESTGTITERDWSRLVARYESRCAYCGKKCKVTLDHVVPLSRGGANTIGNALPACKSCNSSKHSKFISEWKHTKAARVAA